MFIPPEYRSVNCFVCTASLQSASVAVETPSVVVQEEFDILLGVGGTCMVDQGGPQGGGFGAPVGPSWHHSVAFGDGGSATAAGAPATTEHSYAAAGTYEISSDVTCSPCQSVFVLGTAKTTVSVGSGCSAANMDTTARAGTRILTLLTIDSSTPVQGASEERTGHEATKGRRIENKLFAPDDRSFAKAQKRPFYLVTPERDEFKVYSKRNGTWTSTPI